MDIIKSKIRILPAFINGLFVGKEAWQIVLYSATFTSISIWIWSELDQSESIYERVKSKTFRLLRKIPYIAKKVDDELNTVLETIENEIVQRNEGIPFVTSLPEKSKEAGDVFHVVEKYLSLGKYSWKDGYVSGAVYYYDENLVNLIGDVCRLTSYTNPLHPDLFPGIIKMEAEVIKMVVGLFNGDDNACGAITSGGTESIMMACKAFRDYGKNVNGIRNGEIIIPVSAHAAFDKACSYLGMKIKHIDLNQNDWSVNLKSMERAISKNTVLLVASAPNFPYGTADDVVSIGALGVKYGIPVHVDCCLGSFVVAFMNEAGYDVPPFDFRVPGVTSISVDTHKYGFATKGSSVILYSDRKFRHYQYFASLSWPGGLYGSPSVSGSRSGAVVATCWATMMYFGREGYLNNVKKILAVAKYIEKELRAIPEIFVFGKPFSTVIAIGSNDFHIYKLTHELHEKRWNLHMLQFPFGVHICITQLHTFPGVADRFINDVKEAVAIIKKQPSLELEGKVAMYGMSAAIPDRHLVGDITKAYLDAHYTTKDYVNH